MSRSAKINLGKLLEAASGPVYALDEEDCLVYMNAACAVWLDCQGEDVLGAECRYAAPPGGDRRAVLAAALCPPPTAKDSQQRARLQPPGRPAAWASFVPLSRGAEEYEGMLVVVDLPAATGDTDDAPASEPSADELREADALAAHGYLVHFREVQRACAQKARFVGESPAIRRVRRQLEAAQRSGAAALVTGPSGSQKEEAARAIHYSQDSAASTRFVPLSCTALSGEIVVSTVRALLDSIASGEPPPTLFLQEIDGLPPESQRSLAAVLAAADGKLRLVASADGPLPAAGPSAFDEQLAELLGAIVIALPALSDRLDDLPPLAQLFVEDFNAEHDHQLLGFSDEAFDQLFAYDWPGDVAELAGIVREACGQCAAAERREIATADFPARLRHAREAQALPPRDEPPIDLEQVLQGLERQLIERALARAKGNKTKAAELLGLTRPRLYRRLVQLGLAEEDET
jgi:DNA-binding NtrC family response regulator